MGSIIAYGYGASTVDAIRNADSDPENWDRAARVWSESETFSQVRAGEPERWCVLLPEDTSTAQLDRDAATIGYEWID